MRLTPHVLEGAYTFLCQAPPFNRWKLPEADEVEFRVSGFSDCYANYGPTADGTPCISVSHRRVGHLRTLIETIAHEMVHLHLDLKGVRGGEHGREFMRCWCLVAKHLGFDPKAR